MKEEIKRILDSNAELKSEKARLKQIKIKQLILETTKIKGDKNGSSNNSNK